MTDKEFLEIVRREASLDSDDRARAVTHATLRTLGERITGGEATDLARGIPESIAAPLIDGGAGAAEPFSFDDFTRRVAERADVDESEAVFYARAVAAALAEATDELELAREQLPSEFDVVFEPSGPATEREFLETVRERGGFDSTETAREATVMTLRTLGERLSVGEAEDVAFYLPDAFAEALLEESDESATDLSLEEFVARLAQRASVEATVAETYARAACSVLAETISERELAALEDQLPAAFGTLFERAETADEEGTNDETAADETTD